MADDPKRRAIATDLVPGVLATVALGGTFFALHLPLAIAAGSAVAIYAGARLLMSTTGARAFRGADDDVTRDAIESGRAQVRELQAMAPSITKETVRSSIDSICSSADQIFGIFEADPRKAPMARGFVQYTLARTGTIVTRYRDLSSRRVAAAQQTLEKTEHLLTTIDSSFKEQIERLLLEDVADLDSEIEVLKTRLEIEGESEI
jgi:5-bromo-4-chloroindolyl phosphate hydrolysis protein